jgi:hypothetical protein
VASIKKYLAEQEVEITGELTNSAGIADALLNPIVHTYDEASLRNLLASVSRIQILDIKADGNFIALLRKES